MIAKVLLQMGKNLQVAVVVACFWGADEFGNCATITDLANPIRKNMGKPCCNVHHLKVATAHQRCSQVGVLADCI